jgi:hypothetical protein
MVEVSCPRINPIRCLLQITEPAAGVSLRGTVVLGSGGYGNGFYATALVQQLSTMGFLVVNRSWEGTYGWITAEGGLVPESNRYATLLTWIHDHIHKGGKFVAAGESAGSAELGYALTTWGRAAILDLALPLSGPPMARLDYACVTPETPQWTSLCASITPHGATQCPTQACMLNPENPFNVCTQVSAKPTAEQLLNDSVFHPGATLNYPMVVHFIYGAQDCGEPVPNGLTYANAVTSKTIIDFVPNTPHELWSTPEGLAAIVSAIDLGTK